MYARRGRPYAYTSTDIPASKPTSKRASAKSSAPTNKEPKPTRTHHRRPYSRFINDFARWFFGAKGTTGASSAKSGKVGHCPDRWGERASADEFADSYDSGWSSFAEPGMACDCAQCCAVAEFDDYYDCGLSSMPDTTCGCPECREGHDFGAEFVDDYDACDHCSVFDDGSTWGNGERHCEHCLHHSPFHSDHGTHYDDVY